MTPTRVGLVLLTSAIAVWEGYRLYDRSQLSPFAMGSVRAGMRFGVVDDETRRGMGHGFSCRIIGGRIRLCELATDGPIGTLRIVVDGAGRVAFAQFLVRDSTLRWIDKAREQSAEWTVVQPTQSAHSEWEASVARWETPDNRWSAEMSRSGPNKLPIEIRVADMRRLARIAETSVTALLFLAKEGVIAGEDRASAEAHALASLASAADSLAAEGAALGRKAAALPHCSVLPTARMVQGQALRLEMGVELAAVAEQTIARVYPGRRLVIGERATYVVDSTGEAEEIRLYPNAESEDRQSYAFAFSFPERASVADAGPRSYSRPPRCRAPGEIVVVHLDGTRAIDRHERVDVDPEALAAAVGTLEFVSPETGPPMLSATYLGTYGTEQWYGEVKWNELLATQPLSVVRRAPQFYAKNVAAGVNTSGPLIADGLNRNDVLGLRPTGPTLGLSTFDVSDELRPERHLRLPSGRTGPSGWVLLSQL